MSVSLFCLFLPCAKFVFVWLCTCVFLALLLLCTALAVLASCVCLFLFAGYVSGTSLGPRRTDDEDGPTTLPWLGWKLLSMWQIHVTL